MQIAKLMLDGTKLVALFGAVALVVWSMPERAPEPIDKDNRQILQFTG